MIAEVRTKQSSVTQKHSTASMNSAETYRESLEVWQLLVKWLAIARLTGSETAQAALDSVETGRAFSPANARQRAEQILSVMNSLPENFPAAGLTKQELQAKLTDLLALFAEKDSAEVALEVAKGELRQADDRLDKENKTIYGILRATFSVEGTPEYRAVHAIPTTPPHRESKIVGPSEDPRPPTP